MSGTATVTVPANDFFNETELEPRTDTLRRAAIMLASRAPTQQELETVTNGDESTLRSTLRALMSGEGFHRFLTEGTNDRLLVEGVQAPVLNLNLSYWSKVVQKQYEIRKAGLDAGLSKQQYDLNAFRYYQILDEGLKRAAGELVAYIAENDRPYTEVVTADYMMMTPQIAEGLDGSDLKFSNPSNDFEFKPGHIKLFWNDTQFIQSDPVFTTVITRLGTKQHAWGHAGVLSDLTFLQRYPTTPTNRNRARARWTLLNFLDIDIEKSAQRPTDPAALADTNNPTMNNPACTACHERMDPVAAAFQDYGLWAIYRINNGADSLDPNYKFPPDRSPTPYKQGDLWYRDMRTPGVLGQALASNDTLKEAGALIARDSAFPRASVKFWWPSVMNTDVLQAPAVTTDADYQARLTAYQAQAAAIEQFAREFRKDFNLKNLLVEMMMSPWFRAQSTARTDKRGAFAVAAVGTEKLLTPERLHRKINQLTGHSWRETTRQLGLGLLNTGLGNTYRTLYGGIDSYNIIRRSREMTPMMSAVMQNVALESACPIVLKEFMLPDASRKLFSGISEQDLPSTSVGAARIMQKLQELFLVLHGRQYSLDSQEISETFALFQQSWQEKVSANSNNLSANKTCAWNNDLHFFDGLNAPASLLTLNASNDAVWDTAAGNSFLASGLADSTRTKQAWVAVIAYMLSHYDFLYE